MMKSKKNIPTLFENKEECCGCAACYSMCPTSSIAMVPDEEGFLYPIINSNKCICCNLCVKVCFIKYTNNN